MPPRAVLLLTPATEREAMLHIPARLTSYMRATRNTAHTSHAIVELILRDARVWGTDAPVTVSGFPVTMCDAEAVALLAAEDRMVSVRVPSTFAAITPLRYHCDIESSEGDQHTRFSFFTPRPLPAFRLPFGRFQPTAAVRRAQILQHVDSPVTGRFLGTRDLPLTKQTASMIRRNRKHYKAFWLPQLPLAAVIIFESRLYLMREDGSLFEHQLKGVRIEGVFVFSAVSDGRQVWLVDAQSPAPLRVRYAAVQWAVAQVIRPGAPDLHVQTITYADDVSAAATIAKEGGNVHFVRDDRPFRVGIDFTRVVWEQYWVARLYRTESGELQARERGERGQQRRMRTIGHCQGETGHYLFHYHQDSWHELSPTDGCDSTKTISNLVQASRAQFTTETLQSYFHYPSRNRRGRR